MSFFLFLVQYKLNGNGREDWIKNIKVGKKHGGGVLINQSRIFFYYKEHSKFLLIKALHRLNKEMRFQLVLWGSGCESTECSTPSYSLKGKEHCQ